MARDTQALPRAFGSGAAQTREALLAAPFSTPRPSLLTARLTSLDGVGPAAARNFAKLGVETVGDLLEHLPFDHRDYERHPHRGRAGDRRGGDDRGARCATRGCGPRAGAG